MNYIYTIFESEVFGKFFGIGSVCSQYHLKGWMLINTVFCEYFVVIRAYVCTLVGSFLSIGTQASTCAIAHILKMSAHSRAVPHVPECDARTDHGSPAYGHQ